MYIEPFASFDISITLYSNFSYPKSYQRALGPIPHYLFYGCKIQSSSPLLVSIALSCKVYLHQFFFCDPSGILSNVWEADFILLNSSKGVIGSRSLQ